jgi:hypothetical protein
MSERFRVEIIDAAKHAGYRRYGSTLWRNVQDLALLINLQKSRWGDGLYINVGLLPVPLFKNNRPRGSGYWPLQERVGSTIGPYQEMFRVLESRTGDFALAFSHRRDMILWLFDWMQSQFGDVHRVREMILGINPNELFAEYVTMPNEPWMLRDWAHNNLKDAAHYYSNYTTKW